MDGSAPWARWRGGLDLPEYSGLRSGAVSAKAVPPDWFPREGGSERTVQKTDHDKLGNPRRVREGVCQAHIILLSTFSLFVKETLPAVGARPMSGSHGQNAARAKAGREPRQDGLLRA